MKKLYVCCSVLALLLLLHSVRISYALEVETHEAINKYISETTLNGFSLSDYLNKNLGFTEGKEEEINGQKVYKWLSDGGRYEDIPAWYLPYIRSLNHFHNPITEEGFKGNCLQSSLCVSSTVWALMPLGTQSSLTGNYSWYDVRAYYYTALTGKDYSGNIIAADKTQRDAYFAKTFRGMGQLMHLVEDASVPEHTRDEFHLYGGYEGWVKTEVTKDNLPGYGATFFGGTISNIASFIDTNQYNGTNPSNSNGIGLSEYTNANFFSENTIFSSSFPHPAKDETDARIIEVAAEDGGIDKRYYVYKTDGGYNLAAYTYFTNDLDQSYTGIKGEWKYILDEEIYKSYAGILLPRAVGYSAGLLKHFFRGQIEITPPGRFIYAITTPDKSFQEIRIKAKNITSTGEDMPNGQIWLVVKYKVALEDPFQSYPVNTTDFKYLVVPEKNGVKDIPKNASKELTFDLSSNQIPIWATDVYIQVVYKGTLGTETDTAVAVGFKDISEPTPVDIVNNTDHICINGYYFIAGSKEAISAADFNGNGKADDWDVFAHIITNDYLKFSSTQSPQYASSTNYNAKFPTISPAYYGRVFILTDPYESPITLSNRASFVRVDTTRDTLWWHGTGTDTGTMKAIKNQTDYVGGIYYIRYYPILWTERGLKTWSGIQYENRWYPTGNFTCTTSDAQPNLSGPVGVEIP